MISVIIPAYNAEKYIKETILSILKQSYKDIEIIVIDDGSSDNTLNVIESINDERIIVYHQENKGAPSARNKGLVVAKGEFVYFFDADDIMCNNTLAIFHENINKYSADLYIGNFEKIIEDGKQSQKIERFSRTKIYNKKNVKICYNLNPLPINKLYRRDIIMKNNILWKEDLKIGQDLDFYLKYIMCINTVCIIDNTLAKYRIVENGISRTYTFKIFDIVKAFEDIKCFYDKNNNIKLYNKIIPRLQIQHYIYQMGKYQFFSNCDALKVIDFFDKNEKEIVKPKSINFWIKYMEFLCRKDVYRNRIIKKIKHVGEKNER